jgi:Fe-S-cluster containining protein
LLDPAELRHLAGGLGLSLSTFKRRYTRPYPLRRGWRQLKTGAVGCIFLGFEKGRARCTIYAVRPQVCREWSPALERKECLEGLRALEGPPLLTPQDLYSMPEDRERLVAALASLPGIPRVRRARQAAAALAS